MAKVEAKANAVKLIVGKVNIEKEIGLIKIAASKMDHRIHVCALSCIQHIKDHGDNTLLYKLYQALPNSLRRNSFLAWCETFAGVQYVNKDAEGKPLKEEDRKFKKVSDPKESIVRGKEIIKPETANPLTFAKIGEGNEYQGFDLLKALNILIKRATEAEQHAKANPKDVDKVNIPKDAMDTLLRLRVEMEESSKPAPARTPATIVDRAGKPRMNKAEAHIH